MSNKRKRMENNPASVARSPNEHVSAFDILVQHRFHPNGPLPNGYRPLHPTARHKSGRKQPLPDLSGLEPPFIDGLRREMQPRRLQSSHRAGARAGYVAGDQLLAVLDVFPALHPRMGVSSGGDERERRYLLRDVG